ncbi:toxin-antitoxin system HicB family antitoxin [Eupransor demetentiae]|uniref:HicB family (HicB) n=1 Tax=Eupransor demetentiae TaxID=3109584 RepID=A0ABM9N3R2_9LACO|nr:HicB family (HicB) [Lactobacillaceae bacterium LMG 33000]
MQENNQSQENKSGHIALRVSSELHAALVQRAKDEGRSLNNYLNHLLGESIAESGSFETRHFLGRVVSGRYFDSGSHLVELAGIFYRYQLKDGDTIDPAGQYVVIEVDGNVLTVCPLQEEKKA